MPYRQSCSRLRLILYFAITLLAVDSPAQVCQSTKYPKLVLDELVIHSAESFLGEVLDQYHLSINNSFRSYHEQSALHKKWQRRGGKGNPVARPGTSRHESGYAFDLNGLQPLTFIQWDRVLVAGEKYGFTYILGDWEGKIKFDWPHFEADPRKFGKTLQQAIDENSHTPLSAIPQCGPAPPTGLTGSVQ